MDHLPIFCQLRDRACLLVGGGDVAERKARLLLEAGALLTVNAREFVPQFHAWEKAGKLHLVQGDFNEALLEPCWLAIAATNDDSVNQRVSAAAETRRIFCNLVDAPKQASFIMPSIIDRSRTAHYRYFIRRHLARSGAPVARKTGVTAATAFGQSCSLCRPVTSARKTDFWQHGRTPPLLGKILHQ